MLSKLFWLLFVIVFVFVVWKDAPSMVEKHAQVEVPNPVMDMRSQLRVWMGMDSELKAAAEVKGREVKSAIKDLGDVAQ